MVAIAHELSVFLMGLVGLLCLVCVPACLVAWAMGRMNWRAGRRFFTNNEMTRTEKKLRSYESRAIGG